MAGTRYLEIVAKLEDKITQKVEQIQKAFSRFERGIAQAGSQLKRYGRDVEQLGRSFAVAGAAITGPFLLALHNSAQYSLAVSNQFERMKNVSDQFQMTLAEALVPILEKFTNMLGVLLQKWNSLDPVVRQNIIQTTFMTGVYLTLSGVVVGITGKLIKFSGEVLKLGASFIGLYRTNFVLMAIITTLALFIVYWDKLKDVAIPILNTLEVGVSVLAAGFLQAISIMSNAMADFLDKLPKVTNFLAAIGSPIALLIKKAQEGNESLSTSFRNIGKAAEEAAQKSIANIQRITTTGRGNFVSLTESAHGFLNKLSEIQDMLGKVPHINIEPVIQQFNALKQVAQQLAQAMLSSLGDAIFNVITGKVNALKQVFADFGKQVLQILSQALARLILFKTVGRVFPGLGQYFHAGGMVMHSGGMIQRAHSGMLAHDEVPIIAQTGEAVLSRRAVSTLGVDNVYRLNRGQGSVGGKEVNINVSVPVVIQAWDASDVMRNKKALAAALTDELRVNGPFRSAIRTYG
jgi:hypothetical protein